MQKHLMSRYKTIFKIGVHEETILQILTELNLTIETYLRRDMSYPTMRYGQPAKAQTNLHAVWSEPLLVACILWILSYWLNIIWSF